MRLPQELFDTVIDNLSDNSITLRTCSLVARKWRPRSQSHLFSSFTLYSDPRCRDQIQFFMANPHFISYVRKLTIGLVMHGGILLLEEVPEITFTHITTLALVAYWNGTDDAMEDYIRQYLPPLTSLSLWTSIGSGTFSSLISILQECPRLNHLSLRCAIEEKEDEPVFHGKCNLNLEELEISLGSEFGPDFLAEEFVGWMGENVGNRVRVGSLTICWIQFPDSLQGDLIIIQGLLDGLSASLEELHVAYKGNYGDPQDDSEGKISLARCTRMHTLAVDLVNGVSLSTDFSWLLQMVSSTPLRTFRLKVSNEQKYKEEMLTTETIEYVPWAQIHRAIIEGSETHGKALSGFVLDLHGPDLPLGAITEIVESNMPRLKGNIEIRYSEVT